MMQFQQILFDVDGTLIDSREGIVAAMQFALDKANIDSIGAETIQRCIGMPLVPMIQALVPDLDEKSAGQMAIWYREYFADRGVLQHRVYDGMAQLLAQLAAAKLTLTVVTSKPLPFAQRVLEKLDFQQYFSTIYAPDLGLKPRKKGEFIGDFLRDSKANVATCVMIGDRAEDINAANENAMASIGVTYGFGSRSELEQAGASRIADSAAQLGEFLL